MAEAPEAEGDEAHGIHALAPGIVAYGGEALALEERIREVIAGFGRGPETRVLRVPPVVPRRVVERSEYLAAHPRLVGAITAFTGDRQAHLGLLRRARSGSEWGDAFVDTDLALPSAACHPVYHLFADRATGPVELEVSGQCFRREPSEEWGRLQSFAMLEYVYLGSPAGAARFVSRWNAAALDAVNALGLEAALVPASDAFFGTARAVTARSDAPTAKSEVVLDVPGSGRIAVASVNRHEDHFGRCFGIRNNGRFAHSACVGFGIDRLVHALGGAVSRSPDRRSHRGRIPPLC